MRGIAVLQQPPRLRNEAVLLEEAHHEVERVEVAKLVLVVSTAADVQSVLDAEDVLNSRIFELATSSIPFVEVAVRYDWTAAS